jgi:MFS family permease
VTRDGRRILAAQALRALGYGFGAVLLGVTLAAAGWSSAKVGLLLTGIVAGTALASLVVGALGDRIGRRRLYAGLYGCLAVAGVAFGSTTRLWVLLAVALTGAVSTEVVESGPFTSLEQAMLPQAVDSTDPRARTRVFGVYNTIATLAGSLGALAVSGPALLRDAGMRLPVGLPVEQRLFLVFVPIGVAGAAIAWSLSDAVELDMDVEAGQRPAQPGASRVLVALPLGRSRTTMLRLAGLFAVDAFGGGFVVQSFVAYWFRVRFGVSVELLGVVFFAIGLLQAGSFVVATRLAERIGLLPTMVATHLPSNLLLAAIPLAPTLTVAVALLLGRFALSQMDVPARQAYVVALVAPEERTAAVATTNLARYLVRPAAPAVAGAAQQLAVGLPFVLAGGIKAAYDLALWSWFRRVELPHHDQPGQPQGEDVRAGQAGRRRRA